MDYITRPCLKRKGNLRWLIKKIMEKFCRRSKAWKPVLCSQACHMYVYLRRG